MLETYKNTVYLKKLLKNNQFKIFSHQPFSNLIIDFSDSFSKELRNQKEVYNYPDLLYLVFWTRKKKIIQDKSNHLDKNEIRIGRGLLFHICPSNVPTNFIYSFFFGLLSGNSNIVKMPSQTSVQKTVISKVLKKLMKKKKFEKIKKSNHFFEYDHINSSAVTKNISSNCDGRIIWGSDKTVNAIREIWKPERSIDVAFPDRYSISIIDISKFSKLKNINKKVLANKFFYDSYSMNQRGCNSPHFIFWIGKKNIYNQNIFWKNLNEIVEKKFKLKEIESIDKYISLLQTTIKEKNLGNLKKFKNNIYIVNSNKTLDNIENIRGLNGIFFEKNISNINNLKKFITKKCQTISYYGFNKSDLKNFTINSNLRGVDRIVPIGNSLDIDLRWDGFDIIRTLSRIINIS